jgi:hypothetical protein
MAEGRKGGRAEGGYRLERVILSEAKEAMPGVASFASLRMTIPFHALLPFRPSALPPFRRWSGR